METTLEQPPKQAEDREDTAPPFGGGNGTGPADDAPAAGTGDGSRPGDAAYAAGLREEPPAAGLALKGTG